MLKKIIKKKNILIVVPVRDQKIEKKNYLKKVNGKPILFHTIDECLKLKGRVKTIFSSSDKNLINISKKKYQSKIIYFLRNKENGLLNQNLRKELIQIFKVINLKFDVLVILSAEFPFKKYFYIEQAISKLLIHNFDKIVSTTFDTTNNYYKYTDKGIKLISNEKEGTLKYEKKVILKEAGGIWAFNYNSYLKNKINKISNIIVDELSGKNLFEI